MTDNLDKLMTAVAELQSKVFPQVDVERMDWIAISHAVTGVVLFAERLEAELKDQRSFLAKQQETFSAAQAKLATLNEQISAAQAERHAASEELASKHRALWRGI